MCLIKTSRSTIVFIRNNSLRPKRSNPLTKCDATQRNNSDGKVKRTKILSVFSSQSVLHLERSARKSSYQIPSNRRDVGHQLTISSRPETLRFLGLSSAPPTFSHYIHAPVTLSVFLLLSLDDLQSDKVTSIASRVYHSRNLEPLYARCFPYWYYTCQSLIPDSLHRQSNRNPAPGTYSHSCLPTKLITRGLRRS